MSARFAKIAALLLIVVLTIAPRAFADSSVLLVVAGAADQDTAPYELRLRSEFAAEGLDVVTTSGRSQQNILDLEGLARRTGATAALGVFVDAQEVQGRLWVSDPNSNADLVRTLRVTRSEGDAVSVFALRAVEALRGARLELEQQRRRSSTPGSSPSETGGNPASGIGTNTNPTPTAAATSPSNVVPVPPKTNNNPPKPVAKPPTAAARKPAKVPAKPSLNPQPRWTVLGSAIWGYDNNGLGDVKAPAIDARYRLWKRLSAGLAFDGPFISKRTVAAAGVVHVNQEFLELQARVSALRWKSIELEGIGSTAGSRIAVTGTPGTDPKAPGKAASAHSLGWTIGAGVGAQVHLSSHWMMGLDMQWLRRFPAPVIIAGTTHLTGPTDSLILGKFGVGVMF